MVPSALRVLAAARLDDVLLRLVIRHLDRSLTRQEANAIRDRIYLHLHEGAKHELSPNARP